MIQTELQWKQQSQLSKEKSQFKRIHASLKKKIQARDSKIILRLSCMQPAAGKIKVTNAIESMTGKNSREVQEFSQGKKENCLTEPQNKSKQNHNNHSIFKNRNPENTENKMSLKFPTVQRKKYLVEGNQSTDGRPRMIKISLQKLIPLKTEEVKKKFQNKFK